LDISALTDISAQPDKEPFRPIEIMDFTLEENVDQVEIQNFVRKYRKIF